MTIRPAHAGDVPAMGGIAEACGLFPSDMLTEMIAPFLANAADQWLIFAAEGPVAFAFARPEELTDRTWNLLAIGVHPAHQGRGIGRSLLKAAEAALPGARMILIETTQLPEQDAARALYIKAGYEEAGRVRDFFADGEDKVIFRKHLGGVA